MVKGRCKMERKIKEEIVEEMNRSCEEHIKKHGFGKYSLKELKDSLGIRQCL